MQELTHFKTTYPLSGAVTIPDNVKFSFDKWFNGTYQEQKENYIKSTFGFANLYVKTKNQIEYSLFKKVNAGGVVVGKNGCLYEENYITAYNGDDFVGYDSIEFVCNQLKEISDSLENHNKHLLLIFSAGKASFYPEFIPDKYVDGKPGATNMKTFIEIAREKNLHYLNFYDYFNNNKNNYPFKLFPLGGIHWSKFGEMLVLQQLSDKMKSFGYEQPHIGITGFNISTIAEGSDDDIKKGLNLLFDFNKELLAYPKYKFDWEDIVLPNCLVISDSYFFGLFGDGLSSKIFDLNTFLYYSKEVYRNNTQQIDPIEKFDYNKELNIHDVVIVMATESTIRRFGWGSVDILQSLVRNKDGDYKPQEAIQKKKTSRESRIKYWIEFINNDSNWLKDVELRAKSKGISKDSAIVLDAIYQTDLGK